MTRAPRVSVVLPVYDGEQTLTAALQSILQQTFEDFELIVVDDGSSDATPAIISSFNDKRIVPVRQSHQGIVPTLNAGISLARADVFARMDADDLSRPRRLEAQFNHLESHPEFSAVGCFVELFPAEHVTPKMQLYIDWLNGMVTPEDHADNMFVEMVIPHPTLMLRKAAIVEAGGYREGLFPEDYDLLLRLYAAGHRFAKVPEQLYRWREHPQRLSRTGAAYSVDAFRDLKAGWLARTVLATNRSFAVWGAGRDGKRFAKALKKHGLAPAFFIDIDPKKIGGTVQDRPVVAPESDGLRDVFVLTCVGTEGARHKIARWLEASGRKVGDDFLAVA